MLEIAQDRTVRAWCRGCSNRVLPRPGAVREFTDLEIAKARQCWAESRYENSVTVMRSFARIILALCTTAILPNLLASEIKPLYKLERDALAERLSGDAANVLRHRGGLHDVTAYLDSRKELFPSETPKTSRLLVREEKEAVWNAWQRFLDYELALESLEDYHTQFYRLKDPAKEESFLIGYCAFLARYRGALKFITRTEKNPELDKVLNDPVPELGLPGGTYAKLKFKYLNVGLGTEFAARDTLLKGLFAGKDGNAALRNAVKEDAQFLWDAGRGKGELLTAKNALKAVQNGAQAAWLPLQTGVSEWMGHTKVYRPKDCLITPAQIRELQTKLNPGDVLLERREWYLSNIGLPGFWSHAALYIGTPQERRDYFNDAETHNWVRKRGEASGELEQLLEGEPNATKKEKPWLARQEEGHPVRIIEAIGEGVSFKSLEHSGACDSLVVLRPRLSKREKALALQRAFHYAGRPYDFNFDFSTDAELVCTELVYKSYEPSTGCTGLNFPLIEMLGRKVTPANELAKQFDADFSTRRQQFEMVVFLDGIERKRKAVESTLEDFRKTWQRPKWHVLVQ